MDTDTAINLIFLIILIFLSGFFSSAETAFTTANQIRIKTLADEGNSRAAMVLKILENKQKMLSAILVGNNIVNLSSSSLSTMLAVKILGSVGAGVATFIITFLILILGEISPKTLATIHAEKMALLFAPIIHALMWILTPVIWIVNAISGSLLRLFGVNPNESKPLLTEGELKTIVDVGHETGVIESDEKDMIFNVFHFGDSVAREIMVPRIDMVSFPVDGTYEEMMDLYRENILTRVPVYEGSTDNIIGYLHMKDVLLIPAGESAAFSVREILREPYYTYETKNTAELLVEMRSAHVNIAIVLDEYGSCAGMLTMEDLLEEIVGEIRDEYDDDEVDAVRRLSGTEFEAVGGAWLDDINEETGLCLESEDYDTIGGYVLGLSDAFPENGQVFYTQEGLMIRVEKIENHRIDKVYLKLPDAQPAEEDRT